MSISLPRTVGNSETENVDKVSSSFSCLRSMSLRCSLLFVASSSSGGVENRGRLRAFYCGLGGVGGDAAIEYRYTVESLLSGLCVFLGIST